MGDSDEHVDTDPVRTWRELELLSAGYAPQYAELLAARPDIDLHRACDMRTRGCPDELAVDILT